VSLTAPADGANVSGTIQIAVTASDNIGVTKVRFWVDGVYLGYDMTAPYSKPLNTTSLSLGPHEITTVALDAAGNQSTAATRTVYVQ
jgi:hypothetical protein